MNGKKLKFEALISCLYANPIAIIQSSNIRCDVLLINQCDEEKTISFPNPLNKKNTVRVINSKTRGLSVSRNLALMHSNADIVKLCDDDEYFEDDIEENIINTHESENSDIIIFNVNSPRKNFFSNKPSSINKLQALKFGSWQITFKLSSIKNQVSFNHNFGSGAKISSGEENLFLFDCLNKSLKIKYIPILVSSVSQVKSNWFKGYNDKYFYDKGVLSKKLFGNFKYIYIIYFVIFKYKIYKNDNSFFRALKKIYEGANSRLEN